MSVWILYTGDEATSIIDTKLLPTITALVDSLRKQDITTTNTLQVPSLWFPSIFLPSSILKSYALSFSFSSFSLCFFYVYYFRLYLPSRSMAHVWTFSLHIASLDLCCTHCQLTDLLYSAMLCILVACSTRCSHLTSLPFQRVTPNHSYPLMYTFSFSSSTFTGLAGNSGRATRRSTAAPASL